MTVETANYIGDLNKTYPKAKDLISEGDDHIRLIKDVLQKTFPGMNKATTISSDDLNNIRKAFTVEGESLTVNLSTKMAAGKSLNMNGSRIINVGDPTDATDAISLKYLKEVAMQSIWPVQSIFMTTDTRDPSVILGIGTWERFAQGRVIIGAGTGTDSAGTVTSFTNSQKGGEYNHKILESEIPAHTHSGSVSISSSGLHAHTFPNGGGSSGPREAVSIDSGDWNEVNYVGNKINGRVAVDNGGEHTHSASLSITSSGGGSGRMNIVQPYIACNIWRRTA